MIMEHPIENQTATTPTNSSANLLDGLSAVGLVGGAIAAFVTQQTAAAAVPIAVAVGLHIKNRRDLAQEMAQKQDIAIAQVVQSINQHQAALTDYLQKFQQDTQGQQHQLRQLQESNQQQLSKNLADQVKTLQQLIAGLKQDTQETTQSLDEQHKALEAIVGELRQMENASRVIEADPKAEAYYQRGLSHQRLGDRAEALVDYTKAINLNPELAVAYYNRGVVYAELGDRKPAVEDLRQAAKLYFDQGDLDNYHRARDLGKEFYDLQHPFPGEDERAAVATETRDRVVELDEDGDEIRKPLVADDGITVGSLFD